MNYRVVSFAVALATCISAVAQVTRQESTNQLKKVVYSGSAANLQQVVQQLYASTKYYWAYLPVPEIRLANMPNVTLYAYYAGDPSELAGWKTPFPGDCLLVDGGCYLFWKWTDSNPSPPINNVLFTQFKVVVTYESPVSLSVTNLGTGTSLGLKWQPDPQASQKIRGYKVYRQEKHP